MAGCVAEDGRYDAHGGGSQEESGGQASGVFESMVGDMPTGPEFATQRTLPTSTALRECGPVTQEWIELWMKQWKF